MGLKEGLAFWAISQQTKFGDNKDVPPSKANVKGYAKHKAWNKMKGVS